MEPTEGQGSATGVLEQGSVAPTDSAPADWRTYITEDLKADPVVSGWAEKASEKDIPSLLKTHAHLTKRLGNAINLPGKDAKPDEVAALKEKLYEAGLFAKPPTTLDDYGIAKPETLPDGLGWNEETAKKLGETLLKHGASKDLAKDLIALHAETLAGTHAALKVNREAALAKLKTEHGEHFESRREAVARMADAIFQNDEEVALFEGLGLNDHPAFLSVLMRLAPLAMQDQTFLESLPVKGEPMSGEDVRAEVAKVYSDPAHPMYAAFKANPRDPKVEAYIDNLYRRAYGKGQVSLDQGVSVG